MCVCVNVVFPSCPAFHFVKVCVHLGYMFNAVWYCCFVLDLFTLWRYWNLFLDLIAVAEAGLVMANASMLSTYNRSVRKISRLELARWNLILISCLNSNQYLSELIARYCLVHSLHWSVLVGILCVCCRLDGSWESTGKSYRRPQELDKRLEADRPRSRRWDRTCTISKDVGSHWSNPDAWLSHWGLKRI